MADNGKSTAWITVMGGIAVALIGGAVTIWTTRSNTPPPAPIEAPKPGTGDRAPGAGQADAGEPVMGQLESGINRQGMDFSAMEVHAENAPLCAEMCRTNKDCKAMTYVISMKTCWLKRGVPPPLPPGGPDYISSVKQ